MARRPRRPILLGNQHTSTAFCEAVQESDLACTDCCKPGIQAIENRDKSRIRVNNAHASLDLDKAKAVAEPHSHRWDYGIGYNLNSENAALWIEVHGATTNEVDTMVKKLTWLKDWLKKEEQAPLYELTKITSDNNGTPFVWVATGAGVKIPKHTNQYRKMMAAGLKPTKQLDL